MNGNKRENEKEREIKISRGYMRWGDGRFGGTGR